MLYVVATPIGHLGDGSRRMAEVLASVDVVAAEDTRRTGVLLDHLGLRKPMLSLHEHNEEQRVPGLVQRMLAGESVALVSDAGTPLVSDPGYRLVRASHEAGVRVSPIPGPSSVIAALSVAGLPTDRFAFYGFLPARQGQRRSALEELAAESFTLVFLESSHRILASLDDMSAVLGGDRLVLVGRELTKQHETLLRGGLAEVRERVAADANQQKGEFTLVVEGAPPRPRGSITLETESLLRLLLAELPVKQAAALAARITGESKNALYRLALDLGKR
ncbi:MAG: 16S rRNA (cytidine(1402)-2'-O)-methyltransferase [Ectothiorhodospiraceae bacterium]|nr:16S rRNA (cytidine(1402)-2'-O)-methyltransferase [Ectothiorhodospiraceae bacterium]MCH8505642.1 16S rRNA (cytidine(1402)-2'-O)-methyltransferase [Ectothiorhodospiraceae bacterium]